MDKTGERSAIEILKRNFDESLKTHETTKNKAENKETTEAEQAKEFIQYISDKLNPKNYARIPAIGLEDKFAIAIGKGWIGVESNKKLAFSKDIDKYLTYGASLEIIKKLIENPDKVKYTIHEMNLGNFDPKYHKNIKEFLSANS